MKMAITTILIVANSEVAKRSSLVAAILASVLVVSALAIIWRYLDTKKRRQGECTCSEYLLARFAQLGILRDIKIAVEAGSALLPRRQRFYWRNDRLL
jgi:hypothetical protein